MYEI